MFDLVGCRGRAPLLTLFQSYLSRINIFKSILLSINTAFNCHNISYFINKYISNKTNSILFNSLQELLIPKRNILTLLTLLTLSEK